MILKRCLWMIFFLLLIVSFPFHALSDIYIWEDEQGGVHYTDKLYDIPLKYRDTAKTIGVKTEKKHETSITLPVAGPSSLFLKKKNKPPVSASGAKVLPAKGKSAGQKSAKEIDVAIEKNLQLKKTKEQEIRELSEKLSKEREKLSRLGRAKRYKWPIYTSQQDVVKNYEKMIEAKKREIENYDKEIETLQKKQEELGEKSKKRQ